MINLIFGLRVIDFIGRPIKIYYGNSAINFFSNNDKSENRSKHIDIKYLAIRHHVNEHEKDIHNINAKLMIVDPMTKGLSAKYFKNHMDHIGIISSVFV